jgi:hypothetical protein
MPINIAIDRSFGFAAGGWRLAGIRISIVAERFRRGFVDLSALIEASIALATPDSCLFLALGVKVASAVVRLGTRRIALNNAKHPLAYLTIGEKLLPPALHATSRTRGGLPLYSASFLYCSDASESFTVVERNTRA